MRIIDMLSKGEFSLSFEVFPPARDGKIEDIFPVVEELIKLDPHFISVTYGAGGSTRDKTVEIASKIKNDFKKEVLAHLTCVRSTKEDIKGILDDFKEKNIENILALRGDPPGDEKFFTKTEGGFGYANELVEFIKSNGDFSICVAGYPEGHTEAPDLATDIINLKKKVDAGADFIITQLFFDNEDFYRFRDNAVSAGISAPIIPGIFPVYSYKQIKKITSLCGARIPSQLHDKLLRVSEKNEEVEKYGIEHAIRQSEDLLKNDIPGLHFYNMNKSGHIMRILPELDLP